MGKDSKIEWTDHTWNPWQGCRKISAGCKNCYMFRDKKRYGQDPTTVVRSKPATFNAPLKWKKPAKVFVCSWSDFFIREADEWRTDAYEIMQQTPHLTYLLLTKREQRIASNLPTDRSNIWLGVSVENNKFARRADFIRWMDAPIKFLSIEPLVGPVSYLLDLNGIDWVIVGGESGPDARPMATDWARDIRDQCQEAGVAFFMKQMSGRTPIPGDLMIQEFPE